MVMGGIVYLILSSIAVHTSLLVEAGHGRFVRGALKDDWPLHCDRIYMPGASQSYGA